jgi:hypothetical protein
MTKEAKRELNDPGLDQIMCAAAKHTDRLSDSERAMLMGGACAKAYRWSPKRGQVRRSD